MKIFCFLLFGGHTRSNQVTYHSVHVLKVHAQQFGLFLRLKMRILLSLNH